MSAQAALLSVIMFASQTVTAQDRLTETDKRDLPFQQYIDFDSADIRVLKAGPSVYALVEPMQRIGGIVAAYVDDTGIVLVDSGYPGARGPIDHALATVSDQTIDVVINTHWHIDHTDGNTGWAADGALVIAHETVWERRSAEQRIDAFGETYQPLPDAGRPGLTYSDRMTLRRPGQTIDLYHVAAHTDGDTIVHFVEDNVIHIGDLAYGRQYPFIDLGTGGSWQGLIAGLDLALSLANDATHFIPGHLLPGDDRSPLLSRDEVKAFRDMVAEIERRVIAAKADGQTLRGMIDGNLIGDLEERWFRTAAVSSASVLTMVYVSLSSQ